MSVETLAVPLRHVIVGSTFTPTRSIDSGIRAIDLGELGDEADDINRETVADPGKPEIGRVVYVSRKGEMILDPKRIKAYENTLQAPIRVMASSMTGRPEDLIKDTACACVVHSHRGYDLPPSPIDLGALFCYSYEVVAQTSVFVVTPVQKYLVFRGENSPYWDREKIDIQVKAWIDQSSRDIYPHRFSARSQDELNGINGRLQFDLLREICREHHLRFFSCPTRENVATLYTA